MTKEITVEIGRKVYDEKGNLIGIVEGRSENGYCFKDFDAYEKRPDDVCYIGEYAMQDLTEELDALKSEYNEGKLSYDEYIKEVADSINSAGWTKNEIVDMWGGLEKFADALFYDCCLDWQEPSTLFEEWFDGNTDFEEMCKDFGYTHKQFNEALDCDWFEEE